MQKCLPLITLLFAWCAISLWLYNAKMSAPPAGHHAWAMSDYYAMALRFQENDFDFFHPQTYNLRTRDGVTASDLPLPAWLSALGMALTRNDTASTFRFLTWLAGLLGLLFFFKTLCHAGVQPWRSTILALLFGLLPCWAYYHNSLLPSPWAFSAFLFGFWALCHSAGATDAINKTNSRYFMLAIAGFTLAALLRKPFVLYLVAVAAWQWQQQRQNRKEWVIWAGGLTIFGAWQLYDRYMGQVYGSGFLRQLMTPDTVRDAVELMVLSFKKWGFLWLSPVHWVWLTGMAVLLILQREKQILRTITKSHRWFLSLIGLSGLAYCIGMLRQFPDHDYYGIDAFYPALFVGVVGWAAASNHQKYLLWIEVLLLLFALGWAKIKLDWYWDMSRFEEQEKTNYAYYSDSRPLLDRLKIPYDAKMLVFEAYSDNAPLVGMRRMGYCLKSSRPNEVAAVLQLPWDYAVCTDTFFIAEVINDNPELIQQLEYVGGNQDLKVFRRVSGGSGQTLEKLTGLTWTVITDTTFSVPSNAEFLLSKSLPPLPGGKVMWYGNVTLDQPGELKATVALFKNGQKTAIIERSLVVGTAATPTFRSTDIRIPAVAADEMRVYWWNAQGRQVRVEKFKMMVWDKQ